MSKASQPMEERLASCEEATRIDQSPYLVRLTFVVYFALILAWTIAWIIKTNLDTYVDWLATSQGGFAYWTVAKLLIWTLPALWLIRLSGRSVQSVFSVRNWGWLFWGGTIGVIIALTIFIPDYLSNRLPAQPQFTFGLLNALAIAPILEEFLIRGAILGNLRQGYSFWTANVYSAFMFLGLHLPGWYYMGTLTWNLSRPVGGAISVFLVGLAFGYATYKSKSVMGGVLAHFFNNLAASV